ncbi:MAG: hypothetical protein IPL12_03650 [Bacteroidetes bacterium]|nr:hypothetical protein [Bacteroidota bacterium]
MLIDIGPISNSNCALMNFIIDFNGDGVTDFTLTEYLWLEYIAIHRLRELAATDLPQTILRYGMNADL